MEKKNQKIILTYKKFQTSIHGIEKNPEILIK